MDSESIDLLIKFDSTLLLSLLFQLINTAILIFILGLFVYIIVLLIKALRKYLNTK